MSSKHYIVQISDNHLFGDKNRKINGSNSYSNLKNVLFHISYLPEKPDLLISTGDLSQDCTFESYQHLANLLNKAGIKYYLLPGNHDDVTIINKVFDFNWTKNNIDYGFELGDWFIYVLDTAHYPRDAGELSEEQILKFQNEITKHPNKSIMVFLHHHPVPVNSKWIDEMILKDAGHFNKIVQTNKRIKAVLFGHIHQVFEKEINGTFYGSAPATCYQVQSNTEKFSIEKLSAGYRLIELDGDKFSSKVVWVE